MEIGVHYADFSQPGGAAAIAGRLAATARAADAGGVEQLTLMDHFFQMEQLGGPPAPVLEGYVGLGFLAALTERVRLGLLVTGVTYRHPGLLAQTVATLDVLSGGRALLGLGAGWYEREHVGLGVPFPPTSQRFELLEDALQVCRQAWSDDDGPFEGRHVRLAETFCEPRPLGRVPVVVGGSGERKTLRLVAAYADACNVFHGSREEVAHKMAVLDRHCADLGRDPAEVRRTIVSGEDPLADVDGFLRRMADLAAVGIGLVALTPHGDDPAAWTERVCAEVLPRLREL